MNKRSMRLVLSLVPALGLISGCGNPHSVSSMPAPVQRVLLTPSDSHSHASLESLMLAMTGHISAIRTAIIPGYYTWGTSIRQPGYRVSFYIPMNLNGLRTPNGFRPSSHTISRIPLKKMVIIPTLYAHSHRQTIYYDPGTHYAIFRFIVHGPRVSAGSHNATMVAP